MKPVFIAMLSLILGAGLIHAQGKSSLKTQKDKISYIIGLRYGSGLKRQDIEIDYKSFEKGIRDGLKGGRKLLTKAEIQTVAEQFQRDMRNKAVSKNQREAKAFLAKNRRRKGVRVNQLFKNYVERFFILQCIEDNWIDWAVEKDAAQVTPLESYPGAIGIVCHLPTINQTNHHELALIDDATTGLPVQYCLSRTI
ncbi:MAG: FKBP-type peptidyl-prolyl cis-trans isomerase N-terminal domain-containing protein [SAR324 cluster bacterium]|nr:FKBP-type peptidyl-prolyl cis-trans isomerase N-terminal domain-containing protein [SAR324 cluster bacterium]